MTGSNRRDVSYPGLRLRFVQGPKPLEDDPSFLTLRHSSLSRALLENLSSTRGLKSKVVGREALERRLEQVLHVDGEAALARVRDRAREISVELEWGKEFRTLDGIIGTLLGTRTHELASPAARARATREPFDPACLERLQLLAAELRGRSMPDEAPRMRGSEHWRNKAFIEAYFSNYIEGTTFEIEEAESIIFDRKIAASRPKDSHDILRTFEIISDPNEMRRVPTTSDELIDLAKERHARMFHERPEVAPGTFKTKPNRAGDTHFVHPEYVVGTLRLGHGLYRDLPVGIRRATFMMFLVADVLPFDDGNGRIARVMMNAELVAADRSTIIIPTGFREDYLLALRALTRRNRPTPVVDVMLRAQRFSNLDFSEYPKVLAEMNRRNWFAESDTAKVIG
jgi:hypothetical protein